MPYQYGCIEIYSPSASVAQLLYAFVVGLFLSQIIIHMNASVENPPEYDNNEFGLRERLREAEALIVKLQGQRDRAFHTVLAVIAITWIVTVYLTVTSPVSSVPNYAERIEL